MTRGGFSVALELERDDGGDAATELWIVAAADCADLASAIVQALELRRRVRRLSRVTPGVFTITVGASADGFFRIIQPVISFDGGRESRTRSPRD
jgi:hypothetical protein